MESFNTFNGRANIKEVLIVEGKRTLLILRRFRTTLIHKRHRKWINSISLASLVSSDFQRLRSNYPIASSIILKATQINVRCLNWCWLVAAFGIDCRICMRCLVAWLHLIVIVNLNCNHFKFSHDRWPISQLTFLHVIQSTPFLLRRSHHWLSSSLYKTLSQVAARDELVYFFQHNHEASVNLINDSINLTSRAWRCCWELAENSFPLIFPMFVKD